MTQLAIWTDDVDDVELGCCVYSKTHVGPYNVPRGGVVIRVELDADESVLSLTTLEWVHGAPHTFDIPRVDIAEPGDRFFSAEARKTADAIMQWASSKKGPPDPANKARWFKLAADLAEAASHTLYLPGAETRYQRAQAAKRVAS